MKSRIYTRTGDNGTTSLLDGTRVSKASGRVDAYGTVDEANAFIGAARAFADDEILDEVLGFMEHRFYNCSSIVAAPPGAGSSGVSVREEDVQFLERAIDRLEKDTGAIEGFVLPGGCKAAALLHVARTVCRRAERQLCLLLDEEEVDEIVIRFLNRASDLLFCAARYANSKERGGDVLWDADYPVPI